MSNLLINIRFFYWHLQVGKRFSFIKIVSNEYFLENGLKEHKKLEVYKFINL